MVKKTPYYNMGFSFGSIIDYSQIDILVLGRWYLSLLVQDLGEFREFVGSLENEAAVRARGIGIIMDAEQAALNALEIEKCGQDWIKISRDADHARLVARDYL